MILPERDILNSWESSDVVGNLLCAQMELVMRVKIKMNADVDGSAEMKVAGTYE